MIQDDWEELTDAERRQAVKDWEPGCGRGQGGYVPPWVKRLPHKAKVMMCKITGHPTEALEPMTWLIEGEPVPGHLCLRCMAMVDVERVVLEVTPRLTSEPERSSTPGPASKLLAINGGEAGSRVRTYPPYLPPQPRPEPTEDAIDIDTPATTEARSALLTAEDQRDRYRDVIEDCALRLKNGDPDFTLEILEAALRGSTHSGPGVLSTVYQQGYRDGGEGMRKAIIKVVEG